MVLRILFLLLVALNLGAAAWLLFGGTLAKPLPPITDPGVPALRLLAEKPPPARPQTRAPAARGMAVQARSAPAAGVSTARPVPAVCQTLGPFSTTAGAQAALRALSPHVPRIQSRQQQVERPRGFWVYLPAVTTRADALAEAHALVAKGIHDYYVVTASDAQNAISLGLYNDAINAQDRVTALQKLGFLAKVKQRVDTQTEYWLDYAVPAGAAFAWKTWVPSGNDLHTSAIPCF